MRKIKGQVLVETAIILPLVIVFILGIIDFGRAIYTKSTLNNAARSGARAAAVTSSLTSTAQVALFSTTGEPADTIKKYMSSGIPKDGSVLYELKILNAAGTPVTGTVNTGNEVRITLTYPDFPMITPVYKMLALIGNSTPGASNTITLTGEASMRYE